MLRSYLALQVLLWRWPVKRKQQFAHGLVFIREFRDMHDPLRDRESEGTVCFQKRSLPAWRKPTLILTMRNDAGFHLLLNDFE
jgi:hypothetical protein